MQFTGDYLIPAAPERVWEGLNDPEILARSIPGCRSFERTGENEYTATVAASVGPVTATFRAKVELADLDPPRAYTLRGRGQGGPAGFATGEARVTLAPEGDATRLSYVADAEIGGKLASLGGRLIEGVARRNADTFFENFSRALTGEAPPAAKAERGAAATPATGAPAAAGGHIPLIDRVAWLLVGLAAGLAIGLLAG